MLQFLQRTNNTCFLQWLRYFSIYFQKSKCNRYCSKKSENIIQTSNILEMSIKINNYPFFKCFLIILFCFIQFFHEIQYVRKMFEKSIGKETMKRNYCEFTYCSTARSRTTWTSSSE